MKIRKVDHCGLELPTESDRDTAALMIEAMSFLDVDDHINMGPGLRGDGVCVTIRRDKKKWMAQGSGPTPWDAILAAKEASR